MTKLTDAAITAITTKADADVEYVVDVSDTTDDPAGSSRKITHANVVAQSDLWLFPLTVAALATLGSSHAQGDVVCVKSFDTQGDDGGGDFWLDVGNAALTSAGGADGGLIVSTDGPSDSYWRRVIPDNIVTPQMFGAKADATSKSAGTDDTAAIQSAIDACFSGALAPRFSTVYFPVGKYLVRTLTVYGGIHLMGTASNSALGSQFFHKTLVGVNRTGTHDGSSGASVLTDSGESWVVNELIGGILKNTTDGSQTTVTANTATTVTGVLAGGTEDDWDASDSYTIDFAVIQKRSDIRINSFKISDINIQGNDETGETYGIDFSGISYSDFYNLYIEFCKLANCYEKSDFENALIGQGTNNSFWNCRFNKSDGHGLLIDWGPLVDEGQSNVINAFFGCEFASNLGNGVRIDRGISFQFSGCTYQGNTGREIYLDECTHSNFTGYVEQTNTADNGGGVELTVKSRNNHVTVRSTYELMSTFVDNGAMNTLSIMGEGNGQQYYDDPFFHRWIDARPYNMTASDQNISYSSFLDDAGFGLALTDNSSAFGRIEFQLNTHYDELIDRWVTVVLDMDTRQVAAANNMRVYASVGANDPIPGNDALAPFVLPVDFVGRWVADVKFSADEEGVHDGADGASVLTDTSAAFGSLTDRKITNVSDGSFGLISSNTATTITATLFGGTDNDWDVRDRYLVDDAAVLSGADTTSSSATFLTDSGVTFPTAGSGLDGFKVHNHTDGSYGIVTSNTATTVLTAGGLVAGTNNDWDSGDVYSIYPLAEIIWYPSFDATAGGDVVRVRSIHVVDGQTRYFENWEGRIANEPILATTAQLDNAELGINLHRKLKGKQVYNTDLDTIVVASGTDIFGTHTGSNNAASLTDATKAWTTNAFIGFEIDNTTDGSSGRITSNTATTVSVTLAGGTDDDFDTSDAYIISYPWRESIVETIITGTFDLDVFGATELDSSGGAITGTLGSGERIGQIKTIVMTDAANSSTVEISLHQTTDPEIATFDAVDETGVFMWTGTEWITIFATCTFL